MMNNRYLNVYRNGYESPSHIDVDVNITEKRAPTDESIKLLSEMEEKVLKRIVGACQDNFLSAKIIVERDYLTFSTKVCVFYCLNSEQRKVIISLPEKLNINEKIQRIVAELSADICQVVAKKILTETTSIDLQRLLVKDANV